VGASSRSGRPSVERTNMLTEAGSGWRQGVARGLEEAYAL
jgi:hypothetical protein